MLKFIVSLYDELHECYGVNKDECIALLKKTKYMFFRTFGDVHPFCKDMIEYYNREIFKLELEKSTEIAKLDKLWEA